MSTAFGIDIGSDKCVVAYVNKSGVVDVLQNEASKRETPVVVHFDKAQRLFGAAGAARANMDPNSTISQLKRLIGRRFDDPSIKKAFSLPANDIDSKGPIVEGPNGEAMVGVRYRNEDRSFTAVEMLGMFLCYIKRMVKKTTKLVMSDCVIGIPSYLTDQQRKDYLLAAEIAGLKPLRLFHDGAATALDYGIHRKLPHGEVTNVVFVDIGQGDTQVTVVKFWFGTATVLAHSFDRDLGGRDFDDVIFDLFAGDFQEKCGVDVRRNPKATLRLRAACEKAKKVLSSNSDAQISIECLAGDHDLNGTITRTEFEDLSSGLLGRIKAACARALIDADLKIEDIHFVELVGSGSRIPIISNVMRDIFGREPSRTLNGSECMANGCALQCAMLNRAPEASVFGVQDRLPFAVFGSPTCMKSPASTNLIGKGNLLLTPRKITLQPFQIVTISYADSIDLPHGASSLINRYKVTFENAADQYNLEIRVQFDIHGIITIKSASLQPISEALKQPMPFYSEKSGQDSNSLAGEGSMMAHEHQQSPKMQIDEFPTSATTGGSISARVQEVNISEVPSHAYTKETLEKARHMEEELMKQDKASELAKNRRNDLEAHIYLKRDEVSRGLGNLASTSCRDLFISLLKMTEDWLVETGAEATVEAYDEKKHDLDLALNNLLEEHDVVWNDMIRKKDFQKHILEVLRNFELKYRQYLGKEEEERLVTKKQELMSFVGRDGIIPMKDYQEQDKELREFLAREGSCIEADIRRQSSTFTWIRNKVTNSFVGKDPASTAETTWASEDNIDNQLQQNLSYDNKDFVPGVHNFSHQSDCSSVADSVPDGTGNSMFAPTNVTGDIPQGYQQLDGCKAPAMDDKSSRSASEIVGRSEVNTIGANANAPTCGSNSLSGQKSSFGQPQNQHIDNQHASGSTNYIQKRVVSGKPTYSIKKDDCIIIRGRPCQVVEVSTVNAANIPSHHVVGKDIFKGSRVAETVPLSHVWDVPLSTYYYYSKRLENGNALFLADSGGRCIYKLPTYEYRRMEAKRKQGLVLQAEVVSSEDEKPGMVIIDLKYVVR